MTLAYVLPASLLGPQTERLPFALLLGGTISVTSLPVVAPIVDELDLARRNLGQPALAVATVNDVYGFALLSVGAALAGSGGPGRLALALGGGWRRRSSSWCWGSAWWTACCAGPGSMGRTSRRRCPSWW